MNAAGDALAVWPRDTGEETVVEAIERVAGVGWQEPVPISDPAGDEEPTGVRVALGGDGDAVAVWRAWGDPGYVLRTAERSAGGDWSAPEDLSPDGVAAGVADLASDAAGNAVAVWAGADGTDTPIWVATRPPGGEWSEPEPVSAPGEDGAAPRVAVNAAGDAVVVWCRLVDGDPIRAAVRPAGGEWDDPEDVSDAGEDGRSPRIALAADGSAVAAWTNAEGANASVHAAARPAGGGWATAEAVSAGGESTGEAELALDADGTAYAIWSAPQAGVRILRTAALPAGGEWSSPPQAVSPLGVDFNSYELTSSPAVGTLATWTIGDGAGYAVQAARRPLGGAWGGPEDLSTDGVDSGLPELGFDAEGNAVVVWGREADPGYVLQGSGYDFAGPRLEDLRIPGAARVGEPVALSVSPFDVFGLRATTWSFGDGRGAAGTAVTHTYSAPGSYPVAVTALDGSGNASTRTATIAVSAAPAPPPGPPAPAFALHLRLGKESLAKLLRKGKLRVAVGVNEAASVALSGRAQLPSRAEGGPRNRLKSVLVPKRVGFSAAGERRVTLVLSGAGRRALRPLARARITIAAAALGASGIAVMRTATRTLR